MKMKPNWLHYTGLALLALSGAVAKLALVPSSHQTLYATLSGVFATGAYAFGCAAPSVLAKTP